ncbi:MAG TPA: hypothetical protein VGN57_03115 [Pirellulaceae bacterium]|jgi:hypothetical protein|nr:hypothetical protein [Pirellulaceae bacterium]
MNSAKEEVVQLREDVSSELQSLGALIEESGVAERLAEMLANDPDFADRVTDSLDTRATSLEKSLARSDEEISRFSKASAATSSRLSSLENIVNRQTLSGISLDSDGTGAVELRTSKGMLYLRSEDSEAEYGGWMIMFAGHKPTNRTGIAFRYKGSPSGFDSGPSLYLGEGDKVEVKSDALGFDPSRQSAKATDLNELYKRVNTSP